MPTKTTKSPFLLGLRDGVPFLLVIIPFSLLFGIVATEAGLNVYEALAFSVSVVAGASQFTAVQLMHEGNPTPIIVLSALAVNLRYAMYSASLTQYLGKAGFWQRALAAYLMVDQSYATAMMTYEKKPDWNVTQRLRYFVGVSLAMIPVWYACTVIGALVGGQIPEEFALDFALPITFLALIAPMLRTIAHLAAAGTSIMLALGFAFLPYNLGLFIAAICAMVVGAQVELYLNRRGMRI